LTLETAHDTIGPTFMSAELGTPPAITVEQSNRSKPERLLLEPSQLQTGMRVNVIANDELVLDEAGHPLVLHVFETGVPTHKELFPVIKDYTDGKTKILPIGFKNPLPGQEVHFSPAEVFNQRTLPNHGTFVSFCNGKLVTYDAATFSNGEFDEDGYEPSPASPVIKVTHKKGKRFLDLSPVKRIVFSKASYSDQLLFVRLYEPKELEEMVSREEVEAISRAMAQREHVTRFASVAENKRRMEEARRIFGQDFLGPDEVKKAFGVTIPPEQIPTLDVDPSVMEAARREGMMLVLRVNKTTGGSPLTIKHMEKRFQSEFSRNARGNMINPDSFDRNQSFFNRAVPRTGWFFVSKDTLGGGNYLDQTYKLGEYFTHKSGDYPTYSDAFAAKPTLAEAIRYLNMRERDLREMTTTGPHNAVTLLSHSIINKYVRPTAVELVYDLTFYHLITGVRLLPKKIALTGGENSVRRDRMGWGDFVYNNRFIGVGQFDEAGIKITEHEADSADPNLGACISFRV
jgi:hypothetical protein